MSFLKVYRNLHKQMWSVKSSKTGRVVESMKDFIAEDVRFLVGKSGNTRVLKEKRKNVHAYLCSDEVHAVHETLLILPKSIQISYDPYLANQFFFKTYEKNFFIDPKWVLPRVASKEQKVYVTIADTYRCLKQNNVPFSVFKLFFEHNLEVVDILKDALKALIESKDEVKLLDENNQSIDLMSQSTGSFYYLDWNSGLCDYLTDHTGDIFTTQVHQWLSVIFEEWEHFSGDIKYPVKSVDSEITAAEYYQDRLLYQGEYGDLRFQLAEYVLSRLNSGN